MKKIIVLVLSVIIILIIFLVVSFITKDNYNIELKNNIFNYEFGEIVSADVSLFLKDADSTKNIKEYEIYSDELKVKDNNFYVKDEDYIPVGKYKLTIKNKKKLKDFYIEIVDTTSPVFTESTDKIELEETTEKVDLTSYFKVDDKSSVELRIDGDYELSKSGSYNLKVIANDMYNNETSSDFVLIIKEKSKIVKEQKNVTSNQQKTQNNSSNNVTNKTTQTQENNTSQSYSGYRRDISNNYVNQVNSYRKANGLSELSVTSEAQNEADRRSKELVNYYSHDGVGYGFGEVIGHGDAGGDFITAWKNSPPHNATLLRAENTAIAASVYEVNGHWYAAISFRMNY